MARTIIIPTLLTPGSSAAEPAAANTTAGAGNGVTVQSARHESTVFRVTGTNAGNVTVKAGAGAAAISAGQGDLTVAVGAGAVVYIGPFESARFAQADGSLALDTSAAMAVQAIRVSHR